MQQRRSVVFAVAMAVTLILGACSGTTSPTPAASTPAAATATAAAPSASGPAASPSAATVTAGAGGTLTIGLYQTFTSFFPWSETGSGGDSLSMQLQWDQLASYDEKGEAQMRLADSITASSDAKTWTIKLKPNLMWSDGTPLTSKDVIFSWKLGANPKMSYNSGLWSNVVGMTDWQKGPDFSKDFTGITAPDDQTIVFQLINPNAAFESVLLNFRNFILPSAAILAAAPNIYTLDNKGVWALPFWQAPTVGEGPYQWSQTQTGQFMSFKPNPHWREWRARVHLGDHQARSVPGGGGGPVAVRRHRPGGRDAQRHHRSHRSRVPDGHGAGALPGPDRLQQLGRLSLQ